MACWSCRMPRRSGAHAQGQLVSSVVRAPSLSLSLSLTRLMPRFSLRIEKTELVKFTRTVAEPLLSSVHSSYSRRTQQSTPSGSPIQKKRNNIYLPYNTRVCMCMCASASVRNVVRLSNDNAFNFKTDFIKQVIKVQHLPNSCEEILAKWSP